MKSYKSDILAERPEMKKMPYGVPEGYFEDFKVAVGGLSGSGRQSGAVSGDGRNNFKKPSARPFVFAAASVAAALIIGAYFIFGFSRTDGFTQEDLLVFDESYINAEYYEYSEKPEQYRANSDIAGHQYSGNIAETEYSADDIIDYLIYSGVSLEEIETFK